MASIQNTDYCLLVTDHWALVADSRMTRSVFKTMRLAAFRGKAQASDDISFIVALAGAPLRVTRES